MYTSTPLSLLPFSLQHFLLLPSFLQASPPVFPLIILQMFNPLSFYHPHLSLSPHASVTFISIFCLFPPSPSSSVASLSFSPPSSFLQASPPVFAPLFLSSSNVPSSFLLSSSPLSFSPCFRHFYLHLLPLSPFSILLGCFSFFLSSLLFPSSFSPRFRSPFLIILQCSILFPSIILTSLFLPMLSSLLSPSSASFPLLHPPRLLLFLSLLPPLSFKLLPPFSLPFSYHPPMFHPLSFYHPHLSLSPHAFVTFISIFCLFPPSPSSSVASLSFSPPSSFLQASPPVFAPLFLSSSNVPSSFLLSSSPLSFSPCFRHFYLHLLPLSPLLHPPPLLLFLSLLPPLWSLSFSPFSTSTLPFIPGNSSALSAYCLSPSFAPFSTLFQPLYSFSHFSPSLFSVHSHISILFSLSFFLPPSIAFFPPSLV